jgi:hypothetical protein
MIAANVVPVSRLPEALSALTLVPEADLDPLAEDFSPILESPSHIKEDREPPVENRDYHGQQTETNVLFIANRPTPSPPRLPWNNWVWDRHLRPRDPTFPEPAPRSAFLKDNSMCIFLGAALGICNSLTPGFTTMNPSAQAHCLCYSSTVWAPNIFDGAVGQCAGFASTAAPAAYAPLANLEGFCESIGDIEGPKSTTAMTTTYTKVVASQTNPGCAAVTSALVSCMGKTTGFEDMEPTEQAKCFCYDSATSWAPTQFDNDVSACAYYAETAGSSYSTFYPAVTPLMGLCASAGNILSTRMPNPVSTSIATSPAPTSPPDGGMATSTESRGDKTSSDTTLDTTVTIRATRTPVPAEINKGSMRKVKRAEVVGISFCCAAVLLFLW